MANSSIARSFLGLNASFSIFSGLCSLVFANELAATIFTAHANWVPLVLRGIGLGLLLFAAYIANSALNRQIDRKEVIGIAIADLGWVVASAVFVYLGAGLLTGNGAALVIVIAMIVALFAAGQIFGALRITHDEVDHVDFVTKGNAGIWRWVKRGAGVLGGLVISLSLGAASFQAIASAWEVSSINAPGKMVRVGENNLYVHCSGPDNGALIMLENGMGVVSENWVWIQTELSDRYRVCAYDRAGTGFSATASGSVDAQTSAQTLAALLVKMNVDSPIVLVGHSYGALIARIFAKKFPDRVAGLVLVDSSHEDMAQRLPPEAQAGFDEMLSGFNLLKTLNHLGASRMMQVAGQFADGLDQAAYTRSYHLYASSYHMAGAAREAEMWDTSATAAREVAGTGLGNLPLTVLMVDNWPDFMLPAWREMQSELAELSTAGTLKTIKGADHFQVLGVERYARQVAVEIGTLTANAF